MDEMLILLVALIPLGFFMFSKYVFPMWLMRYTLYANTAVILLIVMGTRLFGRAQVVVISCVIFLFAVQFACLERPFRPDWKQICRDISDDKPVWVLPGWESVCLVLASPKQMSVVPFYNADQMMKRPHGEELKRRGDGWLIYSYLPQAEPLPLMKREFERHGITVDLYKCFSGQSWRIDLYKFLRTKTISREPTDVEVKSNL